MLRSKIWLINFVLILGVIGMGLELYSLWRTGAAAAYVAPPGEQEAEDSKKDGSQEPSLDLKNLRERLGPEKDYNAMAEKNLFSATRKGRILEPASPQKQPEEKQKEPPGQPMPVELFGIIWTEHDQAALLNNPYADDPADPNKWFKPGDSVGGGEKGDEIAVMEIHEDHVVLTVDGKSRELYLYKKDKDQQVVATVKNGANSGLPDQKQSQSPPGQEQRESPPGPKRPPLPENGEISEDGKYRIYDTPFGKIKRRIN